MGIYQTLGIVLQSQSWRETSKLVTLYTQDFGKINAIAKGLKAKKGKGKGGLVQFSENDLVFYKKRNGLHLIDKWSLKDSNSQLYGNLKRLIIASVIVEMVSEYVEVEENIPSLYKLLKTTFELLAKEGHEELFLAGFTIHFIDLLGYQPNLEKCCYCGETKKTEPILFSLDEGGVICNNCKINKGKLVIINKEIVGAIKYLKKSSLEKSVRLKLTPSFQKKLYHFLILFLSYTLGREIKSVSLLEKAVAGN